MASTTKRQLPYIALGGVWESDDVEAANRVIQDAAKPDGNFFPLPEEMNFQKALALHEACDHAVAVNSCGTALDLCMIALGIKAGDEVICPGLTFVCTAGAAAARGAKVVFADVDAKTLCLDPKAVEAKITSRTKAIVPVHFGGAAADVGAFDSISRRYGIPIIYDAAHAVGTKYKNRGIGGAGLASCYSFQSNKNMTTLGEGGAITTNDAEFAEKVRGLKTFGYVYGAQLRVTQIGFNYRMTKPQAATGITQLHKIDLVIARRLKNYQMLSEALAGVKGIQLPSGIHDGHGCHLFVIQLESGLGISRADFMKHLKQEWGVGCAIHYPAVWSWEAFESVDHDAANTPVTRRVCEQVVSLPVFPASTPEDMHYLAEAIRETISPHRAK